MSGRYASDLEPGASAVSAGKLQAQLRSGRQDIVSVMHKPDFLVTWLVPLVVFTAVILLYTLGFMKIPSVCICVSVMLLFAGGVMVGSVRLRGRIWVPLGVTLLTATATASALGLYIYDQYSVFPMFYQNAATYKDVVASMPSAAVSDGGMLVFNSDTSVDASKAVGYVTEYGTIYCIAPLHDANTSLTRVEFWAVGIGCCTESGTFECDQVGDPSAHSGIRVWDNEGWFGDANHDSFVKARKKVEATYGMLSASGALYVHWVKEDNLGMLSTEYRNKMIVALVFFILAYLVASAVLAFTLYKPRGPPP